LALKNINLWCGLSRLEKTSFKDEANTKQQSPFLQSVESFMRVRRYSKRTMSSYLYWMKYFILFNDKQHPKDLGGAHVEIRIEQ